MRIAGIDEAGRGPCFGPLVIGICVIDAENEDRLKEIGVKDSKQLSESDRVSQYPKIKTACLEFATVSVSSTELDDLMNRKSLNEIEAIKIGGLLNGLRQKPDVAFIDSPDPIAQNFGKRIEKYLSFSCKLRCEHKADVNYPIVSAASVLAKVERDSEIQKLAKIHGKIGSGYPHDPQTIAFLREFVEQNNALPPFCRKKWETSREALNKKRQTKLFQ